MNAQTYQMNTMNMPQVIYTQNTPIYQPVQQVMYTQPLTVVQTVVQGMPMVQPMMIPQMAPYVFYRNNQQVFCSKCQTAVITNVTYEPGPGTWIMCLGLGICLGPFGAVVFCLDDCKDCQHYCGKCGERVGRIRFVLDD